MFALVHSVEKSTLKSLGKEVILSEKPQSDFCSTQPWTKQFQIMLNIG